MPMSELQKQFKNKFADLENIKNNTENDINEMNRKLRHNCMKYIKPKNGNGQKRRSYKKRCS